MFAQANSEHCRHKIFNADWIIDGERQPKSLFAMIRNTHAKNPAGRALGVSRQRRRHGRRARQALLPESRERHLRRGRRAHRHPHEGGDAQPPDGDLAVSRRGHRLGRRDPRRRRDRVAARNPRPDSRDFPSRTCAFPGFEQPWEKRTVDGTGQAGSHRLGARHHDRRADRRRRVQQRIRPAEHLRLLPQLRAGGGTAIPATACAAITSPS